MSRAEMKLDLSRIVFIGRTFEEYMLMFNLSREELKGRRILDCPAGACSFTAIAGELGAEVTATDIVYYHPFEQLAAKGVADIDHAMVQMEKAKENYKWDYFQSVAALRNYRLQAFADCTADMKKHPHRYVAAVLPILPFEDKEFDITLSAHFLFMYADRLDYEFHRQSVSELMRVTKDEIRIFPLTDLSCNRYEHLDKLIDFVQSQGYTAEEVTAHYEFQQGANSMLIIKAV